MVKISFLMMIFVVGCSGGDVFYCEKRPLQDDRQCSTESWINDSFKQNIAYCLRSTESKFDNCLRHELNAKACEGLQCFVKCGHYRMEGWSVVNKTLCFASNSECEHARFLTMQDNPPFVGTCILTKPVEM